MNDAGSLQNLNDIILPAAVPWWPPAPGWYVLASVLGVLLAFLAIRWWNTRSQNRYRREALKELALMRQGNSGDSLQQLPDLIKRAALAAWPRGQVASLTGTAWHRFLDESAGGDAFAAGAGATLDWLAYRTKTTGTPSSGEMVRVLDAAEFWLKNHVARQGDV